ncbi:MAG: hypothetical protein Q8Q46_01230 [Candidatus Giovannonibacteria bacterium]|nr:hypothetical protein [Candidatus Giovannonibacteria bacterium]
MFYKLIEGKNELIVVSMFGGRRIPPEEEALVLGSLVLAKEREIALAKDMAVEIEKWNRKSPFGYCPACGVTGVEELPGFECEFAIFRCPNDLCFSKTPTEDGGFRIVHTVWHEKKPLRRRQREKGELV